MVEVTVIFEGGADPSNNPSVETMDNTNALRIAMGKLLSSGLSDPNLRVIARPMYSITNVKNIVSNLKSNEVILIDLDGPPTQRKQRIADTGLTAIQSQVFFMVQAMEAWPLSQPHVIDQALSRFAKPTSNARTDESLEGKHPENIAHPDRLLIAIIARHFADPITGKKVVYGKLKHSPDFIQRLDIHALRKTFSDVEALLTAISRQGKP